MSAEDQFHGLGRKPSPPDKRDWKARKLEKMIAKGKAKPVSWPLTDQVLDQDDPQPTGHCVGFGIGGSLNNDDEHHVDPHLDNKNCHDFYYQIKVLEGKPGAEDGAYPRDGLKQAKANGWISGYAALNSLAEILSWLERHGPVIVGTEWLTKMFTPVDGVVELTGQIEGGHCWYLSGFDTFYLLAVNSWGTKWALKGKFKISRADFEKLLAGFESPGEAWAAVQPVPPAPKPKPKPKPKKKCWLMRALTRK